MTYHIVRMNETLQKIALSYQLDEDEVKEENKYIKDWNHLIPGTKLRLPEISTALNEELDNEDPFLEEYYPKLNYENYKIKQSDEIKEEFIEKKVENIVPKTDAKVIKQDIVLPNNDIYYQPYYHPYYPYSYPVYHSRQFRKGKNIK